MAENKERAEIGGDCQGIELQKTRNIHNIS